MNQTTRKREDALRRPTNVSLSEALLAEAKTLGVNVSRACEQGLGEALRAAKARKWQEENAAGFESWNAYVDKHGVPLASYRKF